MTDFTANYNLEPPPSGPIVDKNGVPTVAFLRHMYGLWNRVGSGSGNLIYDTVTIAQLASTLLPQLSAIRAELAQEINNKIIYAVNSQLAIQREQPQLSINITPSQQTETPFNNFGMIGAITNISKSITLDEVLNNGSVSTHTIGTGALTISSGNIQTNGLSTSYGTTSGITTGGVNVVQGTGASATWLISGTSGGAFRAGMQVLDAGGAIRFYEGANHLDFAAGSLTVPGNITSGGSTVKVNGSANTNYQLGNTSNAQLWEFGYNAGSAVAGIYDRTATAFRLTFTDTTGEAKFPANIASTTTTTGTVIVTGGVGVSGQVTAGTFKGNGAALTNLPFTAPGYQEFVSTAAQTVFNTTINTTAKGSGKSYLQVYVSGVFQQEGATKQFTVTGAKQITFNVGLAVGLDVVMYSYS